MLTNPNFFSFNQYLVDFNVRYPAKSTIMVEVLSKNYGDAVVSKMLESATKVKVKDTRDLATRLQKQQMNVWKKMGLNSDDIFKALNLNKNVDNSFESPNFVVWTKFLKSYSGEKTNTFDTLWANLGEKKLATMLVAPKKANGNSVIADLQNSLIT